MPNYPCPPVGFQFTEENIVRAKAFYALWLMTASLGNCSWFDVLVTGNDVDEHCNLPWRVLEQGSSLHYTFTETPLPEGETHA